MQQEKIISGQNAEDIGQQLERDLQSVENKLEYRAILELHEKKILLDIFIDPGGGFESSSGTTRFYSLFNSENDFEFAIHNEQFLDTAGKFFGMHDVTIGHPEFDEKVIVKTNDENRIKKFFKDEVVRSTLASTDDFEFLLQKVNDTDAAKGNASLELIIYEAITESPRLQNIFYTFSNVLSISSLN